MPRMDTVSKVALAINRANVTKPRGKSVIRWGPPNFRVFDEEAGENGEDVASIDRERFRTDMEHFFEIVGCSVKLQKV